MAEHRARLFRAQLPSRRSAPFRLGTAVEKRAVRPFADAFLTTDAEIWINLDASKRRMIFVGYPEHARFDGAVLNARRRTCATRTTISSDGEYARLLLASCFAVAFRHGPMFFDDVVHAD